MLYPEGLDPCPEELVGLEAEWPFGLGLGMGLGLGGEAFFGLDLDDDEPP